MISDQVYDLCRSEVSVVSELAKNPELAPGAIAKQLYGKESTDPVKESENREYDLKRAYACGKWGDTQPSELFLKIYHDVLCTLDKNHPLAGMCSPSLMGSSGVCPLTVIAPIADICRHMSNLVVRAEHEVIIATNFWKYSEGTRLITNALRELSRRAQQSNRRVVVKIMYDRGSPAQVVENHLSVPVKTYAAKDGPVQIPSPDEIPNVDLEVVNYHKPPVGTFHAKYMIVDRRIALLQSNNLQDNDNLEMMAQYEGAIVDSIYDMSMITWHNNLKPPLPQINSPASLCPPPTFTADTHHMLFSEDGSLHQRYNTLSAVPPNTTTLGDVGEKAADVALPPHTSADPHYDSDIAQEVLRATSAFLPRNNEPLINGITRMLNTFGSAQDTKATAPDVSPAQMMIPMIPIPRHQPFPMVMVNREPYGLPTHSSLHTPQNAAFTSAIRNATTSVFIQTPNLNAFALLPELLAAARRNVYIIYYYCLGYNDAGELLPKQNGHNEMIAHGLYRDLEPQFHKNLDIFAYVAKDQNRPIHNKFKKRSCHIKLLIADGHIGIQGSGNQDTQSWYHSQEVNVMIDSKEVCQRWIEGIQQNQNTHLYGQVHKPGQSSKSGVSDEEFDKLNVGCWVDPETGKQADGAIGPDPGKHSWMKGIKGAIERVRGTGGF